MAYGYAGSQKIFGIRGFGCMGVPRDTRSPSSGLAVLWRGYIAHRVVTSYIRRSDLTDGR